MNPDNLLEALKRIQAIADTGLLYSSNPYETERYQELRELSLHLLSNVSGNTADELKLAFPPVIDHPTAKVDVRAFVLLENEKILLVRESADGCWSLPGGWAEPGFTPAETVVKECKEETGLDVTVERLLAVFDKRMHPHPPQPFYVYKLAFHCRALTTEIAKGFDVLDVGGFAVDNLPPLSESRILKSQIELLYGKVRAGDPLAYFD